MSRLLAAALVLATAACTDFATPNQLEAPTIIAVVADPPVVAPGATATLSVVVADATGVLTLPATWALVPAYPGVAPMGTVAADGADATYTAPAVVPDRGESIPPVDAITVTVETADGPRTALKAMPVLPMTTANPTITAITVADVDASAGAMLAPGASAMLQITTDPPATADARYAWYSPVGDIKQYQSNPCELVLDDKSMTGPLIVVVRDGAGGVAWKQVTLTVQ